MHSWAVETIGIAKGTSQPQCIPWILRNLTLGSEVRCVSRSVVSDCDPMPCSMLGFSVHDHLPEFVQTHVH